MMYEAKDIQETLNRNYDVDVDESEIDAELQALGKNIYLIYNIKNK